MWKRWTVCLARGHHWATLPYNEHDDSGFFLRCRRCDYENHNASGPRPTGAGAF